MTLFGKNQGNPAVSATHDGPQKQTEYREGVASAGGYDAPGCFEKSAAAPRVAQITGEAHELAEQYQHAAPLPLPVAVNEQIARSYGQGVTDGMRAGLLNTAERMERELKELRRADLDYDDEHRAGEIAAVERWAARIRQAVTL